MHGKPVRAVRTADGAQPRRASFGHNAPWYGDATWSHDFPAGLRVAAFVLLLGIEGFRQIAFDFRIAVPGPPIFAAPLEDSEYQ
ncbi:MAG: hypothetical protein FD165_2259 [Gammaproteobacteria bacterium]|nr:MAG: hypothetical protein FD165_2259 [Gammaproteobacteria bacterium]